jgi:hypothetical protein
MTNAKRSTRGGSSKTLKTTKRQTTKTECIVEITKTDIYVVYDGIRIAKRGQSGTP